ncbi:MAG TPA: FHA domain-containing protein [Candidatus Limnocylindria bacterium]|nr:FHA domain-containing protein [Candidatus Limnocylindria bacterium]
MQANCTHCGAQHVLKDAEVAAHAKVQFHCSKCGRTTIVEIKVRPDQTMVISPLPSFARGSASSSHLNLPPPDSGVRLPTAKSAVLKIIAGPAKGTVHKLTKARVIVGRDDADVPVNDPEISRHHCMLEVRESYANLKDLDSTNGTFYEEERVRAAMLQNEAEFRIGNSVIRFTLEPK